MGRDGFANMAPFGKTKTEKRKWIRGKLLEWLGKKGGQSSLTITKKEIYREKKQ